MPTSRSIFKFGSQTFDKLTIPIHRKYIAPVIYDGFTDSEQAFGKSWQSVCINQATLGISTDRVLGDESLYDADARCCGLS
jgi:hypothetical protein